MGVEADAVKCFLGCLFFFFSSRRRHTRYISVTGVQTCALPICRVGSCDGTSDEPGRILCPFSPKYSKKIFLISCPDNIIKFVKGL